METLSALLATCDVNPPATGAGNVATKSYWPSCRLFETPWRSGDVTVNAHNLTLCRPGFVTSLLWRHNGGKCVSNHQSCICLLNRLVGVDQRKHQSSASLAFVWGIHRGPVTSPHKGPVTQKMFPFDDVIKWSFSKYHMTSIFDIVRLYIYGTDGRIYVICFQVHV